MKSAWILTSLFVSVYSVAHSPIDITAKSLHKYLEISIIHPSQDPNHYIRHVTVKRGDITLVNQELSAQTDNHSLDIQIPHPAAARKRIRKCMILTIKATCNTGDTLIKKVRVS